MKEIPLTRGYAAIVDDEDYERFSRFKWKADVRKSGAVYAKRFEEKMVNGVRFRRSFYLHREIMGSAGRHSLVDHTDQNTLDCRKKNLRTCSHAENLRNRPKRKNTASKLKGVRKTPSGRFVSKITFQYRDIHIGTFDTEADAAIAYDSKAKELHGEFANLNFKK